MASIPFCLSSSELGLYLISPGWGERERLTRCFKELIDAGLPGLQLREQALSDTVSIDLLVELSDYINSNSRRCSLVFNGKIKILEDYHKRFARSYGVVHLHLKDNNDLGRSFREHFGPEIIIGRSCHKSSLDNFSERDHSDETQINYRCLSPIFKTDSKAGAAPLGAGAIKQFKLHSQLPLFALGGITSEAIPHLGDCSLSGIAASGSVFRAEQPRIALEQIRTALTSLNGA